MPDQSFPAVPSSTADPAPPDDARDGTYEPSRKFAEALENAETLLKYAAEEGIGISPAIVDPIVDSRMRYGRARFDKAELMAFFTALTALSTQLRPVTAASIKACESERTILRLSRDRRSAILLTVFVLLLSGFAFLFNSANTQINEDITSANALAAMLRSNIGSTTEDNAVNPCRKSSQKGAGSETRGLEDITRLQQFAALARDIYKRSLKSDLFILYVESDPYSEQQRRDLELNPAILNYQSEVFCKIELYEKARDFARNVVLDNTYVFGALSLYVLPVLYALVGAYAFRLRAFADTIRKRTFHPSFADSARMIGAFIVGAVVSLFNLATAGLSLSPLAVAFLAGYAVEVFFALLDKIVLTFTQAVAHQPN